MIQAIRLMAEFVYNARLELVQIVTQLSDVSLMATCTSTFN